MSDAVVVGADGRARCWWCGADPPYVAYHDDEWGRPIHDDRALFGLLMLEGFQAGLSWITVLRKREHFARAFDGWDPERVAAYGEADVTRLLADPGIVRNRLKVRGAVTNARAYLRLLDEVGSFGAHLWGFVGGAPVVRPRATSRAEARAISPESDALSRDLRRRGFTFVGSTIVYAFLQSAGLVDDHVAGCWRAEAAGSPAERTVEDQGGPELEG